MNAGVTTTLTLSQSTALVSAAGAAWLMVRAGQAKKLLATKRARHCAACGRRLGRDPCPCWDSTEKDEGEER